MVSGNCAINASNHSRLKEQCLVLVFAQMDEAGYPGAAGIGLSNRNLNQKQLRTAGVSYHTAAGFQTGFLWVTALAVLELTEIHLPLPPQCWD